MSEDLNQRAMRAIRGAMLLGNPGRSGTARVLEWDAVLNLAPSDDELFQCAVYAWLMAAQEASREGMTSGDAWRVMGKPWLVQLVGWCALSELGRSAGADGYDLLVSAWHSAVDGQLACQV
jgi:hypothetical protein